MVIATSRDITDIDMLWSRLLPITSYPFSIVFVGMGENTFSKIHSLRARALKNPSSQHVLQFIGYSMVSHLPAEGIAASILESIPWSMYSYYLNNMITPNLPKVNRFREEDVEEAIRSQGQYNEAEDTRFGHKDMFYIVI